MFLVDGITRMIKLTRGDTGSVLVDADRQFPDDARAILTVKDRWFGRVAIKKVLIPNNGDFSATLLSNDTEDLQPGLYRWEVRIILHPYYNSDGEIVNGDQIISTRPMSMVLLPAIAKI